MTSKGTSSLGHSCGCIPLQIVVLLYSVSLLVLSSVSFFFTVFHDAAGPWLLFACGMSSSSRCVVILISALGIVFSMASIAGVKDGNSSMVRTFARFALMRVIVLGVIRWFDLDTLSACDDNVVGGYGLAALVGTLGTCQDIWNGYVYVAFTDSAVSSYGAYSASRWCRMNDQQNTPPVPKESTPLQFHDAFSSIGRPADASQKLSHSYQGPPSGIL